MNLNKKKSLDYKTPKQCVEYAIQEFSHSLTLNECLSLIKESYRLDSELSNYHLKLALLIDNKPNISSIIKIDFNENRINYNDRILIWRIYNAYPPFAGLILKRFNIDDNFPRFHLDILIYIFRKYQNSNIDLAKYLLKNFSGIPIAHFKDLFIKFYYLFSAKDLAYFCVNYLNIKNPGEKAYKYIIGHYVRGKAENSLNKNTLRKILEIIYTKDINLSQKTIVKLITFLIKNKYNKCINYLIDSKNDIQSTKSLNLLVEYLINFGQTRTLTKTLKRNFKDNSFLYAKNISPLILYLCKKNQMKLTKTLLATLDSHQKLMPSHIMVFARIYLSKSNNIKDLINSLFPSHFSITKASGIHTIENTKTLDQSTANNFISLLEIIIIYQHVNLSKSIIEILEENSAPNFLRAYTNLPKLEEGTLDYSDGQILQLINTREYDKLIDKTIQGKEQELAVEITCFNFKVEITQLKVNGYLQKFNSIYNNVKSDIQLFHKAFSWSSSEFIDKAFKQFKFIKDNIYGRAISFQLDFLAQSAVVRELKESNNEISIIEIGTLYGGSAINLMLTAQNLEMKTNITCIDPLSGYYGGIDLYSTHSATETTLKKNILKFNLDESNFQIRKYYSNNVHARINMKEQDYDLLMIDGDHSAAGVRFDWLNYKDYVKLGGYTLFDDYAGPDYYELKKEIDTLLDKDNAWERICILGSTLIVRRKLTL